MKLKKAILIISFFATALSAKSQVAPFIESINNAAIPSGWTNYNDQNLPQSTTLWKFTGQPAYDASACVDHTHQTGSHFAWVDGSSPFGSDLKVSLETDSIDVSTINQLWLDFFLFSYNVTYDTSGFNLFTVDFYDGTNWIDSIYGYQGSSLVPEWQPVSINLSNYATTGKVKVRFNVTKENVTPWYNDIAIDDIIIRDSCAAPLIFNTDTIAPTFIAFKAVNPVDSVINIEFGPKGFQPGTGTFLASLNLVDTITGLQSNTEYDIYLSNSCDTSARIGPFTIRTDCTGPFGGNYTVGGPNADFPSLDRAVEQLKYCGLSDSVNLYLQGGAHQLKNPISAFPKFQLGYWVTIIGSGVGEDTIKPVGNRDYLMDLRFARSLTIRNLYFDLIGSPDIGIWIHQNSRNVKIDSCIVDLRESNDVAFFGSSTSSSHNLALGNNVENLTISNCIVNGSNFVFKNYDAVGIIGQHSAYPRLKGVYLFNNNFNEARVLVDNMDSVVVNHNSISSREGTALSFIDCKYVEVKQNKLFGNSYGGNALHVFDCNAMVSTTPSIIQNNFISSSSETGLIITNSNRIRVLHNSIYGQKHGTVLNNVNHITYLNNISVGQTRYAFAANSLTPSINNVFDFNVYHKFGYYPLAKWGSTDYQNLANWQADMPSLNMNSHEGNPEFFAVNDLHTHSILCNNKADSTSIDVDIDGDARPMAGSTVKDIGADEYDLLNFDLKLHDFYLENAACGDSTMPIYVIVKNLGTDTIFSYSVTVEAFGSITSQVNTLIADTLVSQDFDTVLVGTINTANVYGSINYKGFVNMTQDQFRQNDTLVTDSYLYKPNTPVPFAVDSICLGTPEATFMAQSNPIITNQWFASLTDTVPVASGDTVQLPVTSQQTYYLSHSLSPRDSISTDNIFGQGVNGHGIMFNIHAKKDITIDVIRVHTPYTFSIDTLPFELYYIANDGYQGNETNPGAWTQNDSTFLITYGFPWPIFNVYINPIHIKKGESYAFYLDYPASQTQTNRVPYNNDMVLEMGVGLNNSFGGIVPQIEFNGSILYSTQACQTSRVPVTAPISSDSTFADFTYTTDSIGYSFTFDASASQGDVYQWWFGDGSSAGGQIVQHHYTFNGQYTVCLAVRDTNCIGFDTICKVVNATYSINEANQKLHYLLYPNPTTGEVRIAFDGTAQRLIRVYSAQGQLLQSIKSRLAEIDLLLDYRRGVYFVEVIEDNKAPHTTRVLKL